MDLNSIKNEDLFRIDWCAPDRARFLRALPCPTPIRQGWLAPGLPAHGLVGTDVSAMDRRSVKAQLAGRGDLRAAWWRLNERVHRWCVPGASTESLMYAFHRRHHALSLAWLTLVHDYRAVFHAVLADGAIAGMRQGFHQCRQRKGTAQ